MKTKSELKEMRTKLDFFMDEKVMVHIVKTDNIFLNGFITSKIRDGVYLMNERQLGNIYLFDNEIMKVEEYRNK
jgi:hypothetical protein